ncbi:MAG: serine/threonine-protein kinase [Anaerolineae bacterium]|nr:serine/threonine-protein kinase [Anaerolineae bacterium]
MPETTQFGGMAPPGSSGDVTLKPNSILQHRYKIMGVLGGGGMGTVYQARDLNFPDVRKLAAIKEMQLLSNDANVRQTALRNFRREANILATLSHPAIPKIFDFFDINDRAYLVMEYINGSDLEVLMGRTRELPVERILQWAIDLCDVLAYLHSAEPEPIIFRDMKPPNVMIDALGKVRLIDFGIAKTFTSGVKHTMIGTEGYSAPEQYKGDVTPLSDIYSLGATLHHILTRKDPRLEPPFSFHERPIAAFNPTVPEGFIAVIEKALAFKPEERYQNCEDMKKDLESVRYTSQSGSLYVPPTATATSENGAVAMTTASFEHSEQTGGIQPKWTFKTEDEIRTSPAIWKDMVFIGSYDTNMWALNLENGELVWKFPTNAGIASSPVIDETNRALIFGSEDYRVYSLDARTGRANWTFNTQDRVRGTPRIAHNHVFFGSDDGRVYALNAVNGKKVWDFETGAPVRSRPAVTNELVIVGCESGEIFGLGLSGQRKWSYRTRKGVIAAPFVDHEEGICYVGSADNYLYALDSNNGYTSWRFRTTGPIISSPVMSGSLVYFGSADGNLYAVNTQNGKEKWKYKTEKPIVGSPAVYEGAVFFGGSDNILYCLDAELGKERWQFVTGGAITSTPLIHDGAIYFGSFDNVLYALPLAM